jgi:hypothetical protein
VLSVVDVGLVVVEVVPIVPVAPVVVPEPVEVPVGLVVVEVVEPVGCVPPDSVGDDVEVPVDPVDPIAEPVLVAEADPAPAAPPPAVCAKAARAAATSRLKKIGKSFRRMGFRSFG